MGAVEPTLAERIDELLPFLAMLERADGAGVWQKSWTDDKGVIHMPWFECSDEMLGFLRALGVGGWLKPFDWGAWQDVAVTYLQPERLAEADVETIEKLFTLHVRRDRFFEGHLAAMAGQGHLAGIVRRLAALRAGLG